MKSDTSTTSLLLEQLSRNSTPYHDPLSRVDWEALDIDSYWLPEQALSLYGVQEFMDCPPQQRMRLSQLEFLHLLEVALWLEGLFMTQLCQGLRVHHGLYSRSVYHLHELREEAGHSLMFLELMYRCGLGRVPIDVGRLRWLDRIGRHVGADSLLFWALTLIGEEVPDRMNRYILRHGQSLCPAVVDIIRLHTIDESRHIAHAKNRVATIMESPGRVAKAIARNLLPHLFRCFVRTVYFPTPILYERAGLMPGRSWAVLAWQNVQRHQFIEQQLSSSLRTLKQQGIDLQWPQPPCWGRA